MLYQNEIIDKLNTAEEILIYGAGLMGKALKTCLTEAPYFLAITSFLVEKKEGNPDYVDEIPVIDIAQGMRYKKACILVALHEKHMQSAIEKLQEEGFDNIIPVSFDSDVWSDIRGNWFRHKWEKTNKIYLDLEHELYDVKAESTGKTFQTYVVHSIYDRVLKESIDPYNYEVPIQVGAALTNVQMYPIQDNQGENISEKNQQYCELTALYWMWKHDTSDYVGLEHYRRKFQINEKQAKQILNSDIDVIVTVPVLNQVGVRQQYCKDHEQKDWDIMLEAINTLHPNYAKAAEEVQKGNYYYAYNMFIARREVIDKYCEWLFPILSYCEEKIGSKDDNYQNRYVGFLAERLLTIYFTKNKQYKLVVAKKHFVESI